MEAGDLREGSVDDAVPVAGQDRSEGDVVLIDEISGCHLGEQGWPALAHDAREAAGMHGADDRAGLEIENLLHVGMGRGALELVA